MRGQDLSKRRHEAAGLAKGCDVSAYYTFKACICTVAWAESCIRLASLLHPPRFSTFHCLPGHSPSIPPSLRKGVSLYTAYHGHCRGSYKKIYHRAALTEIPLSLDIFISRFVGVHPPRPAFSFAQLFSDVSLARRTLEPKIVASFRVIEINWSRIAVDRTVHDAVIEYLPLGILILLRFE